MITTCPKCGYVRQAKDTTPINQCPQCYVDYSIFLHFQKQSEQKENEPTIRKKIKMPVSKFSLLDNEILIYGILICTFVFIMFLVRSRAFWS